MNNLLADYVAAAREHGQYSSSGQSDMANNAHERLQDTLLALIAEGRDSELLTLYDNPDAWVQLWAGTHTLELDEGKAIAKLESLKAARKPLVSMSAKYTLVAWQEGNLSFRNK